MTGRGGRCKHQERQREREGPRRHAPLRFWFLRVSHLRLTPYESSQTLYLIIYSMPRDFLYRESTAFLCDFQALLKLNRVLKPGTRALWVRFQPYGRFEGVTGLCRHFPAHMDGRSP